MSRLKNIFDDEKKLNEKKYSNSDVKRITEEAEMAFWSTVADMVPEADSGDLDPGLTIKLRSNMEKAVKSWIAYNTYSKK